MNSELPKFYETFLPILDILSTKEILHRRELELRVIKKFYSDLPDYLLEEKTLSGEILINNRISWGKSYLKKGGYIHFPTRGHVQITDKGLNHSGEIDLKVLKKEFNETDLKEIDDNDEINTLSPQDLIDEGFDQIEKEVKNDLLERLKNIDPYYFEKVVLKLLQKMGYGEFKETPKSGDGGIDGIINEDKLGLDKIYIQAKRFNENKVREKDIRNFIGAMSGDTNKGVFVTTSLFDQGAIEKAKNAHHKIILIDGNKLVDLMHEYNVGVQIKQVYEVKHLDEDFFIEQ